MEDGRPAGDGAARRALGHARVQRGRSRREPPARRAGHLSALFLLRHAKSSWDDPVLPDHERPLAPRGVEAARRIAKHLRSEAISPELVLCSSARRTRETLALVEPALGDDVTITIEDDLYGAGAGELLDRLRRVGASVGSVMLVGHNPGMEDLAMMLAGDGDSEALEQLHAKFPTAALATLELGDWAELARGRATLTSLVLPRALA